jgi:hypothetical protein
MQQFMQGLLPRSFAGEWRTALDNDHADELPNLRNRNYDDLIVPFARLTLTERFPLTAFPTIWNSFQENDIKFIRCKIEFNAKLKAYFINNLNDNVRCNRLLCPHCHLAE